MFQSSLRYLFFSYGSHSCALPCSSNANQLSKSSIRVQTDFFLLPLQWILLLYPSLFLSYKPEILWRMFKKSMRYLFHSYGSHSCRLPCSSKANQTSFGKSSSLTHLRFVGDCSNRAWVTSSILLIPSISLFFYGWPFNPWRLFLSVHFFCSMQSIEFSSFNTLHSFLLVFLFLRKNCVAEWSPAVRMNRCGNNLARPFHKNRVWEDSDPTASSPIEWGHFFILSTTEDLHF